MQAIIKRVLFYFTMFTCLCITPVKYLFSPTGKWVSCSHGRRPPTPPTVSPDDAPITHGWIGM